MFVQPSSLTETVARLRRGDTALATAIDAACDRVEQVDAHILALLDEPGRRERLRREAAALEERFPQPDKQPPLYGALVGVKDIIRVDGMPTGAGSALPPELFAGEEAKVVRQLRAAGMLVLGRTVTTEFAYFEPGPTRNPHNLAHTPGGSSSGSAAAVAAGLCPLAIGTQTIGSIVRPAAFCGVVGFKPTFGRVSSDGVVLISPSLDHVGLFAADSASIRLAAPVICDGWRETSQGRPPVIGVPDGPYLDQTTPEARRAFEDQLARLRAAGFAIRRPPMFEDLEQLVETHTRLMAGEMARRHQEWFARYESRYRPRTAAFIRQGQAVTEAELAAARNAQIEQRRRIETTMTAEGIDLWACPSALGPAPAGLDSTGSPAMSFPWTFTGLPMISLPAGAVNGLPLGLQLIAGWMADEALLVWAESIERALAEPKAQ